MQKALLVCGVLSLVQAVDMETQAKAGSEVEAEVKSEAQSQTHADCESEAQTEVKTKSGCPYCKRGLKCNKPEGQCKCSKSKRPVLTSVKKG